MEEEICPPKENMTKILVANDRITTRRIDQLVWTLGMNTTGSRIVITSSSMFEMLMPLLAAFCSYENMSAMSLTASNLGQATYQVNASSSQIPRIWCIALECYGEE
jgi:hypothetical protein